MIDPNATTNPGSSIPPTARPTVVSGQARRPDPGSRYAATIAAILSLILVPTVVFLQQCEPKGPPPPPAQTQASTLAGTPETDQFAMVAKVMVKMYHFFKDSGSPGDASMFAGTIKRQLDDAADPGKAAFSIASADPREVRLNKLRAAIVAGELEGDDAALERIGELATEPEPTTPDHATDEAAMDHPEAAAAASEGESAPSLEIAPDLEPLRLVYSGRASELTDDQRTALTERHAWFGKLALSRGAPDTDPARARLIGGGGAILAVGILLGAVLLLGGLASITAFIIMLVQLAGGRLRRRFVPPAPGGSVYLESLMLFALAFVTLKVGGEFAITRLGVPEVWIIVAQWMLLLVPFWPLLRGVTFAEHRRLIGWHSGQGVFREIGAGIFGYLAGLVLLFFAMLLSVAILVVKLMLDKAAGKPAEPPKNPVIEHLLNGGVWEIVMLAALAVVWAPIVEEAVFRGSYFRHLRSRWGVLVAAVVSAIVFGVMHPYPFFLLLPVITLGFIFALLREWRGSLIAPMTAHALHNGTVVGLLVLVLSIMKD